MDNLLVGAQPAAGCCGGQAGGLPGSGRALSGAAGVVAGMWYSGALRCSGQEFTPCDSHQRSCDLAVQRCLVACHGLSLHR